MKTPKIEEFKAWAKAHREAALTVLAAQALAECERERVDTYVRPIFKSYRFASSHEWGKRHGAGEPIDNEKDLYLADLDSPMMAAYEAECDKAHRANGFTGEPGHCPALVAEHNHIKAKNAFLLMGCELFGLDDLPTMMADRAKMLKLLIGACLCEDDGQRKVGA